MEVKVYRQDGTEANRTVVLDPTIFDITPNDHTIWLDVRAIQANARQGTHKAKERGEVAGSTRKLYRQKGTGGARGGSAKSPLRRSGGTIFGPRPRDYSMKINRKVKSLARRSAYTYKAREQAIYVVEGLDFDAPSTRQLNGIIQALGLADRKVLLLTDGTNSNVYLSGRNNPKVSVKEATSASTLDVVGAQVLVFQEGALDALSSVLGQGASVEANPQA
jgi:large subunit ribosomal protein L4